jgi:hypothetical protein
MKIPTTVPEKGFYYHYKHDTQGTVNNYAYELMGVGVHTEEDCRPEDVHMVVYRPLYETSVYTEGKLLYLRPLEMWIGDVTKNGSTFPRFQKITDSAVIEQLKVLRDQMYGV